LEEAIVCLLKSVGHRAPKLQLRHPFLWGNQPARFSSLVTIRLPWPSWELLHRVFRPGHDSRGRKVLFLGPDAYLYFRRARSASSQSITNSLLHNNSSFSSQPHHQRSAFPSESLPSAGNTSHSSLSCTTSVWCVVCGVP
jgi:hypothetical protein